MNMLFLAATFILTASPSFAQLSERDWALIKKCEENIRPANNRLSPKVAADCIMALNDGLPEPLLVRYQRVDQAAACRLISNSSALADLYWITQHWTGNSYIHLARVLKTPDCVLCDMGLGPRPEALFKWIAKYAGHRLGDVRAGVLTWDDEINMNPTGALLKRKGRTVWDNMDILSRHEEKRRFFNELATKRSSELNKKGKELTAVGTKLGTLKASGKKDFLARTFDNAVPVNPGAVPGGGTSEHRQYTTGAARLPKQVSMTAAEAKALSGRLFRMEKGEPRGYLSEVMGQTAAGRRALAFYRDPKYAKDGTNKLNLGFEHFRAVGSWNSDARTLKLNSSIPESFAVKRGMTIEQLMNDKSAMKDLAVYLSPGIIHEAEHQNQTARAIASGLDFKKTSKGGNRDPYTRAQENLSYKEEAEHMIDYCSRNGGPACFTKFIPSSVHVAEKYMEGGVAALDADKAPLYSHIDSFNGSAAREFSQVQRYAKTLRSLEAWERANPAAMPPAQKKLLGDYREMMRTRYKWYLMISREIDEAEVEAIAFRNKYNHIGLSRSMKPLN